MDRRPTAHYYKRHNILVINGKVNSYNVKDFCSAINLYKAFNIGELIIDFKGVTNAYPNGMLPIISTVCLLRHKGHKIIVNLPENSNTRTLFRAVNWAHYLSPDQYSLSESVHDRHLVTRNFTNEKEQKIVVDDFMDVILRNMELPRSIISGLEWSINEITDNVLNHACSPIGGIVEATTYPKHGMIAFAVADAGKGILKSLREAIPSLRTDIQAMGEAVKSGVTRNRKIGQGNGLAGSLKVTTLSGGSFEITSGAGRLLTTLDNTIRYPRKSWETYDGTLVCGQIVLTSNFSISEALDFNGTQYTPVDIIEQHYQMEDRDCLFLKMKNESTGYGTRRSGIQIRTKILNLITAEPNFPLIIDWEGVPVISSSFADEVIGKLFVKLGAMAFSAKIRNIGMEQLIQHLLDKAVAQRLTQESD